MKKLILPLLLTPTLLTSLFLYHINTSDSVIFHSVSNDLFEQTLLDNTLNLHFTLAAPEAHGIKEYPVTLGSYSEAEFEHQTLSAENTLHTLSSVSRSALNQEDALTYDILIYSLEQQLKAAAFPLYPEPLSASGIQTELPILLAEYKLRSKQDVLDYLSLLQCIPSYFEELQQYEIRKADAGLFMSDASLDLVLNNCQAMLHYEDRHFLQTSFEERIKSLAFLTAQEQEYYVLQHKKLLQTHFFPAYEKLHDTLLSLKGRGQNPYGLYYLQNGKAYYEYLTSSATGTKYSPAELKLLLLSQLKEDYSELTLLLTQEPALSASVSDITSPMNTPESMLSDLYQKTQTAFPLPAFTASKDNKDDLALNIQYVDASLEAFLSPAFYLTPPIDLLSDNTIYINDISSYSDIGLYTTLAHEGYPGHMLQNTYFFSLEPAPIRSLLYFGAYSEGWAVYTEQYSYTMTGLDEDLMRVLQLDHSLQLGICCLLDIMIHYEGLTFDELTQYADSFNSGIDEAALTDIYQRIIDEPANYLKYYIGYLEICRLRAYAEKTLGNRFQEKDFHRFFLSVGPAPFFIIEEREDVWLQTILSSDIAFIPRNRLSFEKNIRQYYLTSFLPV